jgi:hypothetical protein
VAHAALVVAHGSARDVHGFAGSRMGGVGGRLEPCEGRRWLRCALKRYGQFCCGTRSRSHTRGQRAVLYTRGAWWWGGGIDVVHERGSERIGIFVVLRRHTRSQRHTCGHRAIHVVHGERWERYTWPHTHGDWGGMHEHVHETREVAASRERPMRTSKNIGVFCGYALVAGLSRGFTCICGQGVAHAAVGFACSALREGHSPRGGPKA